MKKILYSEMDSLGVVMDSILKNPALQKGVKSATLFKFWNKVVGKKFEKVSTPISLSKKFNNYILLVACESAVVSSELMLYKTQLIKKFNTFSKPLEVEISDICFSHKHWKTENKSSFEYKAQVLNENPYKEDLTGFDEGCIEISEEEIKKIKENVYSNKALTKEQQERLLKSIIRDIKVQKFLNK